MADYYSEFAESYLVTPEQAKVAQGIFAAINFVADNPDKELPEEVDAVYRDLSEDLQESIHDYGVGFYLKIQEDDGKTYLTVMSDEGVAVETVLYFLSDVLETTDDHTIWTMTWSAGCTRPRSGEFGGGAAAISMTGVEMKHTWDVAEELVEKMRKAEEPIR